VAKDRVAENPATLKKVLKSNPFKESSCQLWGHLPLSQTTVFLGSASFDWKAFHWKTFLADTHTIRNRSIVLLTYDQMIDS
jgi:hypothetical protein